MNKKVLIGLGIAGFTFACLFIVGSMQPEKYRVERSVLSTSTPQAFFPLLNDLRKFSEWSPWEGLDPKMKKTMEGPESGEGAKYIWEGNDDVGAGQMTIVRSSPNERVDINLEFIRPWQSTSQTSWILSAEEGNTKVTWVMEGNREGVFIKTLSLLLNMDKMIGKDFEKGLNKLKDIAENSPQASANP